MDIRRATNLKYLILRVRQKISYEAFRQGKTSMELIVLQILKSLNILILHGDIDGTTRTKKAQQVMDAFSSSHLSNCFRMLIQLNALEGNVELED